MDSLPILQVFADSAAVVHEVNSLLEKEKPKEAVAVSNVLEVEDAQMNAAAPTSFLNVAQLGHLPSDFVKSSATQIRFQCST